MGMTIDEAQRNLRNIQRYYIKADSETIDFAIDIVRKYQKIQEIINHAKDSDGAIRFNWLYEQISEVIDGA